jgi:hypothetical protein
VAAVTEIPFKLRASVVGLRSFLTGHLAPAGTNGHGIETKTIENAALRSGHHHHHEEQEQNRCQLSKNQIHRFVLDSTADFRLIKSFFGLK